MRACILWDACVFSSGKSVCVILYHCMFLDVMPERKRKKKEQKGTEEDHRKKRERERKGRMEKETSLFWDVGVIFHFIKFCIFIQ